MEPLPLALGDLFEQPLELLIVGYGLAHALLPAARHEQLLHLSPARAHQLERGVQLTLGAATVELAADALARRHGAMQQPAAVDQLGDAGAQLTLGIGEAGASRGCLHD